MNLTAMKTMSEDIPAEKYINLSASETANISQVKIIPPTLGEDGFGFIHVEYRVPVYKVPA